MSFQDHPTTITGENNFVSSQSPLLTSSRHSSHPPLPENEDADAEIQVDEQGGMLSHNSFATTTEHPALLAEGSQRKRGGRKYTIHDEVSSSRVGESSTTHINTAGSVSSLTESDDEVEAQPKAKKPRISIKREDESSSVTESDDEAEILSMSNGLNVIAWPPVEHTKPMQVPAEPTSESISEFTCPICFSPPTFATATLCGHVMCGECLFSAVKAQMQQNPYGPQRNVAR